MAIAIKADFVGLVVRAPARRRRSRARAAPQARHRPQLVAKIETAVALDHLPGIVGAADAVMVARGDLGIQVPARRVPLIQKEIIRFCNMAGKPVITATQMLESMTRSPLPTRAEVNDVANAVLDGTDALMLSEETAVGDYPADTVRTMSDVAEAAEAWPRARTTPQGAAAALDDDRVAWAVAHAAVQAAEDLGVARDRVPDAERHDRTTGRRVPARRADHRASPTQPEVLGRPVSRVGRPTAGGIARRRRRRSRCRGAGRHATAVSRARAISSRSCPASPGKRAGAPTRVRIVRA